MVCAGREGAGRERAGRELLVGSSGPVSTLWKQERITEAAFFCPPSPIFR